MNSHDESFGSRLHAELKKLHASHLLSADYGALQRLKQADRDTTVKMFYGSSYDIIQQLKVNEPEEVARYMLAQAKSAAGVVAGMIAIS
jgi:hypothetical protein